MPFVLFFIYDARIVELTNRSKVWRLNGKLHRTDGPAVEYANGDKEWWQNGLRHRIDGPAIEYTSGHKEWYQNGQLHRVDGPAIEYPSGNKKWYKNDKYIKFCYSKPVPYVKNKGTENEEEMELEICCKECAKFYYGMSEEEFNSLKK